MKLLVGLSAIKGDENLDVKFRLTSGKRIQLQFVDVVFTYRSLFSLTAAADYGHLSQMPILEPLCVM